MLIRCEIVSQDRLVFEGDADMVVVPGTEGEMGILPNHIPLLATLALGTIKVRNGDAEEVFAVTGGIVEVQPDIITILADAAEHVDEIDIERAEAARQRAIDFLEKGPSPDASTYLKMQAALSRSNLRLELANRRRKHGQRARPPGMGS